MAESVVHELAEQRLGRTLRGKWTLDEILGVGGMATVYGATHRNGAHVAIKMLHATLSSSKELRRRFVREAYLVNKVEHPQVVRVLDDDVDEVDGSAFLVMDHVPGVSLAERAEVRAFDEQEILEVAEQLLEILAVSHQRGVIHRDLKPENLLVDDDGTVRLLDFGIARLLEDDGATSTRTGITFGTPGYMAPEQALGQKDAISARTDLYGVGATLFTLMTGEFVHQADTPQELLVRIATRPARSLSTVVPDVSPEVALLVDRATMQSPDDRWPSAEAMLAEVRRLMARRGLGDERVRSRRKVSARVERVPPRVFCADAETAAPIDLVARRSMVEHVAEPTRPSLIRQGRRVRTFHRRVIAAAVATSLTIALLLTLRHPRVNVTTVSAVEAAEPTPPVTTAAQATTPIETAPTAPIEAPPTVEAPKPNTLQKPAKRVSLAPQGQSHATIMFH